MAGYGFGLGSGYAQANLKCLRVGVRVGLWLADSRDLISTLKGTHELCFGSLGEIHEVRVSIKIRVTLM